MVVKPSSSNQILQTIFEKGTNMLMPILNPISKWNEKLVEKRLRKYGLRWDDILDDSPEMVDAMKLVPAQEVELRNRRLHRAIDMDLKHVELPKELQRVQAPWKSYLTPYIYLVRARQEERVTAALPSTKGGA